MNHFFKNIRVVNPAQKLDLKANLWIKDGKIMHCSPDEVSVDSSAEIIDGEGLIAAPGLFDMHVHLREPGDDLKETIQSGTEAAANGGFTGVVCMPNTNPTIDDVTVVEYIKSKSKDLLTDVYISGAISQKREGKLLAPMMELADAGVVLFTDDGTSLDNSEIMRRAFDYASAKDYLLSQHCEDASLTKGYAMHECALSYKLGLKGYPSVAEEIIVSRDIMLAKACGNRRYHVSHLSTKGAVELVRRAKADGQRVSSEVTPHHFSLTCDLLSSYDTNLKMNPPLREEDDRMAVINGLKDGTIDCIASDHAPHTLYDKEVEYERAPNGIIGLETSLGLALTNLVHAGHLTVNELVDKMSCNPRKLLNLPVVTFEAGACANMVVFAPDEEWIVNKQSFKSKSDNMPFDGMKLKGKPKYSVNNGKIYKSSL